MQLGDCSKTLWRMNKCPGKWADPSGLGWGGLCAWQALQPVSPVPCKSTTDSAPLSPGALDRTLIFLPAHSTVRIVHGGHTIPSVKTVWPPKVSSHN